MDAENNVLMTEVNKPEGQFFLNIQNIPTVTNAKGLKCFVFRRWTVFCVWVWHTDLGKLFLPLFMRSIACNSGESTLPVPDTHANGHVVLRISICTSPTPCYSFATTFFSVKYGPKNVLGKLWTEERSVWLNVFFRQTDKKKYEKLTQAYKERGRKARKKEIRKN